MKRITTLAALVTVLAASSSVLAQDKAASAQRPTKAGSVLQVGEITIVGRIQKPIAAVDVGKIQPKITIAELRQPFLDRIEAAVKKDPF